MTDAKTMTDTLQTIEETLSIDKRVVETGRVRIETNVDEVQVVLRDVLSQSNVEIERIPIGCEVDVAPLVREDGDILIVPVVEERLVVEKRLFLVEEIRLQRSTVERPVEIPATRRVMSAVVLREEGPIEQLQEERN